MNTKEYAKILLLDETKCGWCIDFIWNDKSLTAYCKNNNCRHDPNNIICKNYIFSFYNFTEYKNYKYFKNMK